MRSWSKLLIAGTTGMLAVVAGAFWIMAGGRDTSARKSLATLAAEIEAAPTIAANLNARGKQLQPVLTRVREHLPSAGKIEDTRLAASLAHWEWKELADASASFDAAVLALRDLANGKPLLLVTPTGNAATHPRIGLRTEDLPSWRAKAMTSHREIWMRLEKAMTAIADLPSSLPLNPAAAAAQKEIDPLRSHGDIAALCAFAAMIGERPEHVALARKWLMACCAIERWATNGGEDGGHENGLVAAHSLEGAACAYDWLYPLLTESERGFVRTKLANQAAVMYAGVTPGRSSDKAGFKRTYFQNHNWINNTGLGLAGWALQGEFKEADEWIAQCEANARAILTAWAGVTDGSNHEGYSYWAYGIRFLLITLDQIKRTGHGDLFRDSAWLRAQVNWRAHGMLPNRKDVLAVADCTGQDPHGVLAALRKLAAEFGDGTAEELAREQTFIDKKLRYADMASWEFLWFDPTVAPRKLEALPLAAHFPDQGLVTARSDWGPDATLFSFKCGAPGGRSQFDHARAEYPNVTYLDVGHDHPDQNSFTLYARRTHWLDDGGYDKPKLTANHNTVLVDGQGQIGEGKTWFSPPDFTLLTEDRTARIVLYRDAGPYVEIVGEAARCYPARLGLKTFTRRVLFLRPGMVLVHDELAAERPCQFDYVLRRYENAFVPDAEWIISKGDSHRGEIAVQVLAPAVGEFLTENFKSTVRPGTPPLYGIKLRPKTAVTAARFVTLLCPLAEGQGRPRATLSQNEITVSTGDGVAAWKITIPPDAKTPATVNSSSRPPRP